MSNPFYSNDQTQELRAEIQQLTEENLRLRTELEAYRMSKKGKKGVAFFNASKLKNANFTETIILNVKVSERNWLSKMDDQDIAGWNDVRSKYIVDNTEPRNGNGAYFLIVAR